MERWRGDYRKGERTPCPTSAPASLPMLLTLSLYLIGFVGFVQNRKHVLLALLSIELMLLAATLLILLEGSAALDGKGLVLGVYALVIAGAESAIGLALVVNYHRNHGGIHLG